MRITAQNILKLTAILTIACLSSCKQLHTKKELTELYGLKIVLNRGQDPYILPPVHLNIQLQFVSANVANSRQTILRA